MSSTDGGLTQEDIAAIRRGRIKLAEYARKINDIQTTDSDP